MYSTVISILKVQKLISLSSFKLKSLLHICVNHSDLSSAIVRSTNNRSLGLDYSNIVRISGTDLG